LGWERVRGGCGFGLGCFGVGEGFGFCRGLGSGCGCGAFGGEGSIDGGGFGGVNVIVVLVRFGELLLIQEEGSEAVGGGEFEVGVHLDGVEGADLDADLAAHADGDIDVEFSGIELGFADGVGLFVRALFDEDALGGTLFFADLAGDAAHALLPIFAVVDEEGEIAVIGRQLGLHLGIFLGDVASRIVEAAHEIFGRDGETLN